LWKETYNSKHPMHLRHLLEEFALCLFQVAIGTTLLSIFSFLQARRPEDDRRHEHLNSHILSASTYYPRMCVGDISHIYARICTYMYAFAYICTHLQIKVHFRCARCLGCGPGASRGQESFVYFSGSNRNFTIALRVEILHMYVRICTYIYRGTWIYLKPACIDCARQKNIFLMCNEQNTIVNMR